MRRLRRQRGHKVDTTHGDLVPLYRDKQDPHKKKRETGGRRIEALIKMYPPDARVRKP